MAITNHLARQDNPPYQRSAGSRAARFIRAIKRAWSNRSSVWLVLNAQMQLRRRAGAPVSVRLKGGVRTRGGGKISLGESVTIDGTITPVEFVATRPGRIEIGAGSFINYGVSISAHDAVVIGRSCHIGHYCFIYDNDLHEIDNKYQLPQSRPVVLEDRVWLGTRAIVLKGVKIGHDSVIGAGSVVTGDIAPCSVAVGTPARVIRVFQPTPPSPCQQPIH